MFFSKKSRKADAPATTSAEWKLPVVTQQLRELLPTLESADVERDLISARLADHYRDAGRDPGSHAEFVQLVRKFDPEAWRRMALVVGSLDHADIRSVLTLSAQPVLRQIELGFVGVVKKTDALTLAILRQSEVRVEEFARHFAAQLGVNWHGETSEQSADRLQKIDYKRLLAEAEDAKKSAEERMAALRKKQEEELARRRPRGKQ
jgi:hypothetical protein